MHRLAYVAVATVLALVEAAPANAAPVALPIPSVVVGHPPAGTADVKADAVGTTGAAHPGRFGGRSAGPVGVTSADTQLLSVLGAGPFRIGARLDRLTAAGLIDWSVATCDGVVRTGVTGPWAGVILLAFRHGRLVEVSTATAPPYSPAGAGVGMNFTELETIYGPRGELIRNDTGTASGYLVRVGPRVELFTGHPIRPGVGAFQVGTAAFVERGFRHGGSC
ncbi:hypothetical protein SAMN05443287_101801 [Micromonospora phaseoli]|uniref:MspA protein n=1 Tax=Micromonospora phaseoli TaxID=1144548 RepID=A0A1H6SS65_9ACTN|nr:hypothetical protein [Micromonospora phaseoli]PZW04049.1 hypothetical protein CLV64_101801 [Micromonospora phaseoli]GIJ81387.1 hypothetical protein Xph01_58190 [Micromonospora phaseoli]SEI69726.1 hypothetical protein SAMN05443287_101801 [Micromonospora phaseoli]